MPRFRSAIAVPLAALLAFACTPGPDGQMSSSQNTATFAAGPGQVIEALTGVLQARQALSADMVPGLRTSLLESLQSQRQAQLSSRSVAAGAEELAGLVPEDMRRFIGDEGGRYVLELTIEPAPDGGTRLTVNPVIIATVGGGEGPLGGRPLPSNGSLERAIFEALRGRLAG